MPRSTDRPSWFLFESHGYRTLDVGLVLDTALLGADDSGAA
ncbi:MAG TPA: hypothetical protein VFZ79_17170 [Acidimicrobiales bacterium]